MSLLQPFAASMKDKLITCWKKKKKQERFTFLLNNDLKRSRHTREVTNYTELCLVSLYTFLHIPIKMSRVGETNLTVK